MATVNKYKINADFEIVIWSGKILPEKSGVESLLQKAIQTFQTASSSSGSTGGSQYLPKLGVQIRGSDELAVKVTPHGVTAFSWDDAVMLTEWLSGFEGREESAMTLGFNVIKLLPYKIQVADGGITWEEPPEPLMSVLGGEDVSTS